MNIYPIGTKFFTRGKHIGMLESDKGKRYDEGNFKLAQQHYLKGIV